MPYAQNDQEIAIVDLNDSTRQVGISSGSGITAGQLGFLSLGMTPALSASYMAVDAAGNLKITGSVSLSGASTVAISNFPVTQSVTGSVGISGIPTVTGSITVPNIVTITGSVGISTAIQTSNPSVGATGSTAPLSASLMGARTPTGTIEPVIVDASRNLIITGTVAVTNTPVVTGSVSVLNTVTVTGSASVLNTVTITGSVGVTQDPAEGSLGVAVPTKAIYAAGTDPNGLLRGYRADVAGRQITINENTTSTGALGALNAAVTVALSGSGGAGFQLAAGTLIGTLLPEISFDGGTTWVASDIVDHTTDGVTPSLVFTASNTAKAGSIVLSAGCTHVRIRVSAFTSGTANLTLNATQNRSEIQLVSMVDGQRVTYSGTSAAFASAATATDIFVIGGSATKKIRVLRIEVYATQTTAGAGNIFLLKRSTADTGGTSTVITKVPHDSTSAAATATVLNYTANPTTGTLVGNIRAYRGIIPASATAVNNPICRWEFGENSGSAIVLAGTAEQLAVNLNSVTVTGGSFIIGVQWTEE